MASSNAKLYSRKSAVRSGYDLICESGGGSLSIQKRIPVLIVGGGPVGLACALGLAHHGITCTVLEQDLHSPREARTLNLWARVMETFADWNVLDALRARGTFLSLIDPVDAATDRRLFCIDLSKMESSTSEPGSLAIPQNVTEEVLRERVEAEPACQLLIGKCISLQQDAEGVTVVLSYPDGAERRLRAEYVVGADGAHSIIRRTINVPLEGETHPQRMVLSDEYVDEFRPSRMRFAVREPGFLVGLRFDSNMWRLYSSIPEGATDAQAVDPQSIDDRIETLFGHTRHETRWISTFNVHRRVAARYRVGRVLLAGDAAHLTSPIGGQGMNSGILDAENLAWKLAMALNGGDADALLNSYHEERHWVMTNEVARRADQDTRLEFSAPPWLKKMMIRSLASLLKIPRIQASAARTFSMLDSRYPNSTLLVGDHSLLGSRLHNLKMPDGRYLSSQLKGKSGVLLCKAAAHNTKIDEHGALPVFPFPQPPRAWRIKEPTALIVRPDRHAGAVVVKPQADSLEASARHALGFSSTTECLPRGSLAEQRQSSSIRGW